MQRAVDLLRNWTSATESFSPVLGRNLVGDPRRATLALMASSIRLEAENDHAAVTSCIHSN